MNRLWRLLRHLFGNDPPPRPEGHRPAGHRPHHHGHEGHNESEEEARREVDEQIVKAADEGPAPTTHHGH